MKKILLSLLLSFNVYSKIILKYDGFIDQDLILNEINECKSDNQIQYTLKKFNFKTVKVTKENKNFIVYIEDNKKIDEVEFNITFIEKNLIKNIKYIQNPSLFKKIIFYPRIFLFKTYLNAIRLNINEQHSSQIAKNELDNSTKNLKKYFLSIGYTNISITYEVTTINDKNILRYHVSLNKIETIGIKINEENIELKKEINTIIPPFNMSFYTPYENFYLMNFSSIYMIKQNILNHYKDYGYLDAKIYLYFDKNSKKLVFNAEKGQIYKLKYDLDTLINYEKDIEKIDDEKLKKIEKILKLNINIHEKKNQILKILQKIYQDKKINININNYSFTIKITTPKYKDRIISKIKVIESDNVMSSVSVKNHVLEYYLYKKVGDYASEKDLDKIEESISFLFKNVKVSLKKDKKDYCILIINVEQKSMNLAPTFNLTSTKNFYLNLSTDNVLGSEYRIVLDMNYIQKFMIKLDINLNIYNNKFASVGLDYIQGEIFKLICKYDFISINLELKNSKLELIFDNPFNVSEELYNIVPELYLIFSKNEPFHYLIQFSKLSTKYMSSSCKVYWKINSSCSYKYNQEQIIYGVNNSISTDSNFINSLIKVSASLAIKQIYFEDKILILFELLGGGCYDTYKKNYHANCSFFFNFEINFKQIIPQIFSYYPITIKLTYQLPILGDANNKGGIISYGVSELLYI